MFSFNPLWKTLIDRDMTKTQLRELIGISTSTLSKLSKDEYVSMQVLDSICEALNVKSISQVVEYISTNNDTTQETNLDILERLVDSMINDKMHGIEPVYETQGALHRLLIKAIDDRIGRTRPEDADQFYITYTKCITNNLLPPKLAMETIQAMINKDNNEPQKKPNNKMRWF